MKKLNNKGFAISTLLYGLLLVAFMVISLLMSLMSTNRKNTSTLVRKIEEELNRYSETATELTSTTSSQEFIVPYGKAGWYKIELWGAGHSSSATTYGQGTYTSGIIYLEENQHLYFYIGRRQSVPSYRTGQGLIAVGNHSDSDYIAYASTAMSTDVRLESGSRYDSESLKSRIMIASGGNGGQSYISGYAGSNSIKEDGTIANNTRHYSGMYFTNGIMIPASNSGAGRAKITLVSTSAPTSNNNDLRYIRRIEDCIQADSAGSYEHWSEIQAISGGVNVAYNRPITIAGGGHISPAIRTGITDGKLNLVTKPPAVAPGTGKRCLTLDLNGVYSLEEIAIFHNKAPNYKYSREEIKVTYSNGTTKMLLSWTSSSRAHAESTEGIRISSKDIKSPIPTGKYYIQSIAYPAAFVSAVSTNAQSKLFDGSLGQTWAIEAKNGGYAIINSEDGFALQAEEDYLYNGGNVATKRNYSSNHWDTWRLFNMGNGYYQLQLYQSGVGAFCLKASNSTSSANFVLGSCGSSHMQYFKLISADY